MAKISGTIRPTETQTIEAEGTDYASARAAIEERVPEGWELIKILVD